MPPANREFYFFLSNLYAFYSLPCVTTLAGTPRMLLNRSNESRYLHFVIDLRGKHSIFTLSVVLCNVIWVFLLFG
jgi:hypothetical protein